MRKWGEDGRGLGVGETPVDSSGSPGSCVESGYNVGIVGAEGEATGRRSGVEVLNVSREEGGRGRERAGS